MSVLFNGQWLENPQISLHSEAVLFGRGLFESFVSLEGGRVFNLEGHLARFLPGMEALGVGRGATETQIRAWLRELLQSEAGAARRVKLLALPEGLFLFAGPVPEYKAGPLKLVTYKGNRGLWRYKSTAYLEALLAFEAAQQAGGDEALLTNHHGTIYEGSRSSFLWIKDGKLRSKRRGVLPGTTCSFLSEAAPLPFHWETLELDQLPEVEGALVASAGRGLAEVGEVDGVALACSPQTAELIHWFAQQREERAKTP
ncbi:MAG: aminotransferase class IV [bacterium]|nr:aminotransferase class IV [bacterium]